MFKPNDKAETPVLWPPHAKSWLIGKDSDYWRDWGQEEKGTTEDEMAGWYQWLNVHEFEWTPGDGDGQGGLVCCSSRGRKELDTTEWLNWTELNVSIIFEECFGWTPPTHTLSQHSRLLKGQKTSHSGRHCLADSHRSKRIFPGKFHTLACIEFIT